MALHNCKEESVVDDLVITKPMLVRDIVSSPVITV